MYELCNSYLDRDRDSEPSVERLRRRALVLLLSRVLERDGEREPLLESDSELSLSEESSDESEEPEESEAELLDALESLDVLGVLVVSIAYQQAKDSAHIPP